MYTLITGGTRDIGFELDKIFAYCLLTSTG